MISTVLRYGKVKARKPPPGTMNKTEARYAEHLAAQKRMGRIRGYWFEAMNLRLGDNCHFRPDFMVVAEDWTVELHEVKGFKRKPNGGPGYYATDDAKVKLKVAADKYPFRFVVAFELPKKDGGYWEKEEL